MRSRALVALCVVGALATASPGRAVISVGQPANAFTKDSLLASTAGAAVSLSDYGKRVKILFLLGFD